MQDLRAAGQVGGKIEGGGGGERDRACGGVWPGWVARPWPRPAVGRAQSRDPEFSSAISGTGRGQRSRMARARSNTQRARISASAAGASGKAENTRAAALAAAETGSPSPAQAFRLDARPFGSTARSSRAAASAIRPGSRLGGRPAQVAPQPAADSPQGRARPRRRSAGRAARLRRR